MRVASEGRGGALNRAAKRGLTALLGRSRHLTGSEGPVGASAEGNRQNTAGQSTAMLRCSIPLAPGAARCNSVRPVQT